MTIVLEGKDTDGSVLRWMFTEITPGSFHWLGYTSPDNGKTWRLEQEMFAKRRAPVTTEEGSAWWRRNDLRGLESARLQRTNNGWLLVRHIGIRTRPFALFAELPSALR